jgi:hypothetical protein
MATTLGFRRFLATILAAAGLAAGETAKAGGNWMPMLPDQDFYDFQLFAPPDLDEYGIWEDADDGIFFEYNRLYWAITVPRVTGVGTTPEGNSIIPTNPISPYTIVDLNNAFLTYSQEFPIIVSFQEGNGAPTSTELNLAAPQATLIEVGADPLRYSLNTSWMRTKMSWGNRYEGGWSYDGSGVKFAYFQLNSQSQDYGMVNEFAASSPTQQVTTEFDQESNAGVGDGGISTGGGATITSITIETTSDSPPPDHLITQQLYQTNETTMQGGSAALTIQRELGRLKGSSRATFALGPRFLQFAERYQLNYASYQNSFNTAFGGTTTGAGGTGAGGTGGGGTGGGGTGGGGTGAGGTGGGVTPLAGSNNGTFGVTGAAGNVFDSSLGGAGQLGIVTGNLPSTLTGEGPGSLLQTAAWETYTDNNIVGPELGVMFEGHQGRWTWRIGGTFTAGFNWQNNLYRGANLPNNLGADYLRTNFAGAGLTTVNVTAASGAASSVSTVQVPPGPLVTQIFPTGQVNTTNNAEHRFAFTPIGEWRLGTQYRVSQAIMLNFGYTGMWLSQIARASSNTGYETVRERVNRVALVPDPNDPTKKVYAVVPAVAEYNRTVPQNGGNEYVFTNGIDFGIEVKY